MKKSNCLKNQFFLLVVMTFNTVLFAQKIDTDSLLISALKDINQLKNYDAGLKKANLGIQIAPDYLDFYLLKGRIYQLTKNNDSARIYFKKVITKNPKYEEAFSYLIALDLEEKKYPEAIMTIESAIVAHPENKAFNLKKHTVYQLQNDDKNEYAYLKLLAIKYPDDNDITQRLFFLETKRNSDRLGVNYSYTNFSRNNYGPWHLGSLQYIRERNWGSIIARVNYADRLSFGQSLANGIQYEGETYFFTGKKSYSYAGIAYSKDVVFPKLRFGYSYFQNFKNGWEGDIGFRYTKAGNRIFKTAVLGLGKYFSSYWINLKTFLQTEDKALYPAFTLTSRYYFDTRFDYFTMILGYGTSPDERTTLGQFDQRIALNSYRISGGYYKMLSNHYLAGIQTTFNNQEYAPGFKQNELELSLLLQYKF